MDHDTRRLAIVHVGYHAILDAFARPAPFRHAYFSDHPQLPKGCEVVEVREDPCRRCFAFTITHPDLPEVADGAMIPVLFDEPVELTVCELIREADGRYRITPELPLVHPGKLLPMLMPGELAPRSTAAGTALLPRDQVKIGKHGQAYYKGQSVPASSIKAETTVFDPEAEQSAEASWRDREPLL